MTTRHADLLVSAVTDAIADAIRVIVRDELSQVLARGLEKTDDFDRSAAKNVSGAPLGTSCADQIKFIRTKVFNVTQAEFSAIAGVVQPSVSRWENGECEPSLDVIRKIINEARERGLNLKAEWFFEDPKLTAPNFPLGVQAAPPPHESVGDKHVRSLVRSAVGTDGGTE